jgi:hypothetical protein
MKPRVIPKNDGPTEVVCPLCRGSYKQGERSDSDCRWCGRSE